MHGFTVFLFVFYLSLSQFRNKSVKIKFAFPMSIMYQCPYILLQRSDYRDYLFL